RLLPTPCGNRGGARPGDASREGRGTGTGLRPQAKKFIFDQEEIIGALSIRGKIYNFWKRPPPSIPPARAASQCLSRAHGVSVMNHPARRISLRSASALLNSSLT